MRCALQHDIRKMRKAPCPGTSSLLGCPAPLHNVIHLLGHMCRHHPRASGTLPDQLLSHPFAAKVSSRYCRQGALRYSNKLGLRTSDLRRSPLDAPSAFLTVKLQQEPWGVARVQSIRPRLLRRPGLHSCAVHDTAVFHVAASFDAQPWRNQGDKHCPVGETSRCIVHTERVLHLTVFPNHPSQMKASAKHWPHNSRSSSIQ